MMSRSKVSSHQPAMRQIGFRKQSRPKFFLSRKPAILSRASIIYLSPKPAASIATRLVLKARVPALDQKGSGVRDCSADGFGPAYFRVGKVAQNEVVDERLVAGLANADPHAARVVADMGAGGRRCRHQS
jgi:hypothetical protein